MSTQPRLAAPPDPLPDLLPDPPLAPITWESVYAEHAERVAGWAARLGGPTIDGEDLVHEVFIQVQRLLPRYDGTCKITTWLYGITANVVRSQRRQERRRWLRHLLGGREQARTHSVRTPIEELERREATEIVYRVLDGMRENYRTALILFEIEGLSGDQIAELTGASVQTVWVWLHRARAQFREEFRRKYPNLLPALPALSYGGSR